MQATQIQQYAMGFVCVEMDQREDSVIRNILSWVCTLFQWL